MRTDFLVIGAGAIGIAVAEHISRNGHSVLLAEKEKRHGTGVSSRSSEVIHAGIYYTSGSMKAVLCLKGRDLLYDYCTRYGVRHKRIGKLFLAASDADRQKLEQTHAQAGANGVNDLVWLGQKEINEKEPALKGVAALFSPSSGIFDSHGFMDSVLKKAESQGAIFVADSPVIEASFRNGRWALVLGDRDRTLVEADCVINSAGLDAIALSEKFFPGRKIPSLYPTKGCYARLTGRSPVKHIVYPAMSPGVIVERVDATPDLSGSLRFGPTIEGTDSMNDFSLPDGLVKKIIPGIKRYLPDADERNVHPDYSGIRPKIYGPKDPVKDFMFDWAGQERWLDLWGMESPGLTASLAIGEHVYEMFKKGYSV